LLLAHRRKMVSVPALRGRPSHDWHPLRGDV